MTHKGICALIFGVLLGVSSMMAYAADSQQVTDDENTVVGACMIQKFKEKNPSLSDDQINKCADADSKAAPKCLGISEDDYLGFAKFCVAQLENAKCVATKMNVPLMKYANCGYENDPVGCYKGLGFTTDQIVKLSTDCEKK